VVQTAECCAFSLINQRSVLFNPWPPLLFLFNVSPNHDRHCCIRKSDKTIKLWKVFEKSLRVVSESNHYDSGRPLPPPSLPAHLRLPRMMQQDNIIAAVPRKVYSNAHAYHIHSISVNSDQETYISADDLRINLWNLNISDQSFSAWLDIYSFLPQS